MERYLATFAHSEADSEKNTIRAVGSVFGSCVETYIPTFILPNAFKKTIAENKKRIKILYQHEYPIGLPLELYESKDGLEFGAKISDTTLGRDVMTLVRDGVIAECSIGFDPVQQETYNYHRAMEILSRLNIDHEIASAIKGQIETFDKDQQFRFISQVRLHEISLVTWGADPNTKITEVHRLKRKETVFIGGDSPKPKEKRAPMSLADIAAMMRDVAVSVVESLTPPDGGEVDWYGISQACSLCSVIMQLGSMPAPVTEQVVYAKTCIEKLQKLEKLEGKMLSGKNKRLIADCVSALQALLDAAEPPALSESQALSDVPSSASSGPHEKEELRPAFDEELDNWITDQMSRYQQIQQITGDDNHANQQRT